MTTPTDDDYDDMHHALGRPERTGVDTFRNYYCCETDGPTYQRFEQLGWWDFVRFINDGTSAIFCVNGAGTAALASWMNRPARTTTAPVGRSSQQENV